MYLDRYFVRLAVSVAVSADNITNMITLGWSQKLMPPTPTQNLHYL